MSTPKASDLKYPVICMSEPFIQNGEARTRLNIPTVGKSWDNMGRDYFLLEPGLTLDWVENEAKTVRLQGLDLQIHTFVNSVDLLANGYYSR